MIASEIPIGDKTRFYPTICKAQIDGYIKAGGLGLIREYVSSIRCTEECQT